MKNKFFTRKFVLEGTNSQVERSMVINMVFYTGEKSYRVIREVFAGKVNDVYVCRDVREVTAPCKAVWLVKRHRTAKMLIETMDGCCGEFFMQNENAGFVFPYFQERPLLQFYMGAVQEQPRARCRIWLGLVAGCMTSGLPAAVLNLMLRQERIHIGADGALWFDFCVDLSEYNGAVSEKDNVEECADLILRLIGLEQDAGKLSAVSLRACKLLEKKLFREEYHAFIQLYRDIKLIGRTDDPLCVGAKIRKKLAGIRDRFAGAAVLYQDRIYRLMSGVCVVLVCAAALTLVGYFFFGEFSFWRLFGSSLDRIGTESLLR